MELKDAIINRHSIRGFTNQSVSKEVVEDILKTAGYAVSSKNTQPWQYAVITGEVLKKIGEENVAQLRNGDGFDVPDTVYEGVYRTRQIDVAKKLFTAMEIGREDKEKRDWWMERGFRFFDAPVAIILYVDANMDNGITRFDVGAVTQLDLLIDVYIPLVHTLDAKGKLKVYTRICDIGDSSKGCHNTLLLVVHREETGEAADQ